MSTNKSSTKENMAEFVVQPEILEAKYANYFGVQLTNTEVVITFAQLIPEASSEEVTKSRVVSRVAVSLENVGKLRELLSSIEKNIKNANLKK